MTHVEQSIKKDLINILRGFSITKNFQSCLDTWQKIVDGEVSWGSSERKGRKMKGAYYAYFSNYRTSTYFLKCRGLSRRYNGVQENNDFKDTVKLMKFNCSIDLIELEYYRLLLLEH